MSTSSAFYYIIKIKFYSIFLNLKKGAATIPLFMTIFINVFFSFLFVTVRQENERLLQDSLHRAKMAVNFTEPPLLSVTTSSPLPSHPAIRTQRYIP